MPNGCVSTRKKISWLQRRNTVKPHYADDSHAGRNRSPVSRHRQTLRHIAWPCVAALALAACSTVPVQSLPGPAASSITVARRGWHTDVCVRSEDAGTLSEALAPEFEGARFLCFGFGERQFVLTRTHNPLTALRALFPSQSAVLMTVLRASPAAAFGRSSVTTLAVNRAGLDGLQSFLRQSIEHDASGVPLRLGEGPYPGSEFFAATGTYDAFYTCNAWTADALRSAGLPVGGAVLFSGDLIYRVRHLPAAAQPPAVRRADVTP